MNYDNVVKKHETNRLFSVKTDLVASQPLHWHSFFEIELFVEGDVTHYINGKKLNSQGGFITLLSPSDFHLFNIKDVQHVPVKKFVFYEEFMPDDMIKLLKSEFPFAAQLNAENLEFFLKKFERLLELDGRTESLRRNVQLRHLTEEICLTALSLVRSAKLDAIELNCDEHGWKSHFVIEYISRNYLSPISLKDLANELHYSENYMSHFFTNTFGISFSKYLKMMRVDHAAHLLEYSDEAVSKVSEKSGFNSPNFFNRAFKEIYGMTPNEYRKERKNAARRGGELIAKGDDEG